MNNKEIFIKNTFWIYFFTIISAPLGYFIRILYAKNLTPEEFGLFYSILGFFGIVSLFNDLGFTETLKYYGIKFLKEKNYEKLRLSFYYSIIIQAITSLLLIGIIMYFSNFFAKYYFKSGEFVKILPILSFYFIIINIIKPIIVMLEINFNYFLNKLYNFLYLFIVLLFSSIFYFCFKKINIIIISYIWSATFVFLFILFFIISLKKYKFIRNISIKYEKKLIKELFSYGLIVVIGSSATILLNRIDVQMITYFLNLKDVAYYQIALSIGSILTILFSPVSIILQTLSSKLILENKKEELNKLLSYIYLFILFISLPIFLILILYNKLIINLLFSSNYFYSSKLSIIILFFYYINIYLFINYSIIFGLKKLKEKNKMLIVAGIFNIILNYILIKYFDIYGAGIATLIVTSYLFIYSLIIMFKENVKINLNLRTLFKILILNLIFLGTIFILKKIAIENIYLKIIFVLIISLSEYYILGWFMKIYKINKIIDLLNIKLSKKFGFIKKI